LNRRYNSVVLILLFSDTLWDLIVVIVVVVILLSVTVSALVVYVVILKRTIAAAEAGISIFSILYCLCATSLRWRHLVNAYDAAQWQSWRCAAK